MIRERASAGFELEVLGRRSRRCRGRPPARRRRNRRGGCRRPSRRRSRRRPRRPRCRHRRRRRRTGRRRRRLEVSSPAPPLTRRRKEQASSPQARVVVATAGADAIEPAVAGNDVRLVVADDDVVAGRALDDAGVVRDSGLLAEAGRLFRAAAASAGVVTVVRLVRAGTPSASNNINRVSIRRIVVSFGMVVLALVRHRHRRTAVDRPVAVSGDRFTGAQAARRLGIGRSWRWPAIDPSGPLAVRSRGGRDLEFGSAPGRTGSRLESAFRVAVPCDRSSVEWG